MASVNRDLWSVTRLSVETGLDRHALSTRLGDLKPDSEPPPRWRLSRVLKHLTSQKNGTLEQEKLRLLKEQADSLGLKNMLSRGEIVPVEDVTSSIARVSAAVVSILDAIPMRLKRADPTLTSFNLDIVRSEIVKAREECADLYGQSTL